MPNREQLTLLSIGLATIVLVVSAYRGWIELSEISSAIAFGLVTVIFGGIGSIVLGRMLKGTEFGHLLVMKRVDRHFDPDMAKQLDPKFSHVQAVFFYPKELSWVKSERNPQENMPRYKAIVNTITKRAFGMGVYAMALFEMHKIDYMTETGNSWADMNQFLQSKGVKLEELKLASEADLLEGTAT